MENIHVFRLQNVKRQNDQIFIKAINEASAGDLSQESLLFLNQLSRPLPHYNPEQVVHIYATTFEVAYHNADCLLAREGEWNIFVAKDEG